MRKLLFKRILPVLTLCITLALGTLYGMLRSQRFMKSYLLPLLSKQLGQPLSAERVEINPFGTISLAGVRLNCEGGGEACPADQPLTVRIGSLQTEYDLSALFSRQLHITSLRAKDVHVGITSGLEQSPPPAAQPQVTPAPSSPSNASTPGFTFRISDASLEQSSFRMGTKDGSESYRLEGIAITIPEAHSHQDSRISIKTRATIRNSAVNLENQPISLTATLRNATLFMPLTVDLETTAGASAPAPIDLKGSLVFSQEPYGLTKISVSSGVVRQSLLQILAIPTAPIQDFEYSLKGDYSLTSPALANVDLTVQKNLFASGNTHDLKGTTVRSKMQVGSDRITISDGALTIVDNNSPLVTTSLQGDLSLSPYTSPSSLSINASLVDCDRIRSLLQDISPTPSQADPNVNKEAAPQAATSSQKGSSTDSLKLPVGSLDVRADKIIVQNIETKSFTFSARVPGPRTIERASLEALFPQGGNLSMNATGSLDSSVSFRATGKDVNMIPFAATAAGPKGEILEGSLKALDVNLTANGKDIRKTLQGHATVSLSRLIVPSTLQEQVPFNILFLPLDALITVFGGTLNLLLPASISSISDSIRQTLDDAGRLGIDNSIVDLRFEQGKILLKNVDINTKNLPDFTFKGNITADDRLDLTVFIALLKLNLPLPIAGTMSTPLPDVVYLGPELVRGLGLSVGSLAGSAVSIFGGSKDKPSGENDTKPQPAKK